MRCARDFSVCQCRVLRVGSFRGISGQFASIQAAVDAAKPGDWILVGPGDYKTTTSRHPAGKKKVPAGAARHKVPDLHPRDEPQQGVRRRDQARVRSLLEQEGRPDFGPGKGLGLNGVMVWKAANVWVQNLTACNFLSGTG